MKTFESPMMELTVVPAHSGHVTSVLFSPNGRTLMPARMDKAVKVWGAATWELLRTLEGHENSASSLPLSAAGRLLACGSTDTRVNLWSFPSGEVLNRLTEDTKTVACVRVSPRGLMLASASYDSWIRREAGRQAAFPAWNSGAMGESTDGERG